MEGADSPLPSLELASGATATGMAIPGTDWADSGRRRLRRIVTVATTTKETQSRFDVWYLFPPNRIRYPQIPMATFLYNLPGCGIYRNHTYLFIAIILFFLKWYM
jgi:hypothetical protein